MNYDFISFLIFVLILILFYLKNKKKFEIQGKIIAIYRTKLGLNLMDKMSKAPRFILHFLGSLGIATGFIGMIFMFYIIFRGTLQLIITPSAQPVLAPVLPGVSIPGLPVLSFWHWVISIFIVAVIHEFSHGILSRFHNIKIKSSGFAFFGPILAAFVEPDESQLRKKSKYAQLSVFSAGPFSNILTALFFSMILFFIFILLFGFPLNENLGAGDTLRLSIAFPLLLKNPETNIFFYRENGINISAIEESSPAFKGGLKVNDTIKSINGKEINSSRSLLLVLKDLKPNEKIIIATQDSIKEVVLGENPNNKQIGYLGITVVPTIKLRDDVLKRYGSHLIAIFSWLSSLFFWMWVISIGIALFNLLPLGPIDGGRMFLTGLSIFIKNPKSVKRIWSFVGFFTLSLIVINLLPFIFKLLKYLLAPLLQLIF